MHPSNLPELDLEADPLPEDLRFPAGFVPSTLDQQIREMRHQYQRQRADNDKRTAREYGQSSMHHTTSVWQMHRIKSVLHTLINLKRAQGREYGRHA